LVGTVLRYEILGPVLAHREGEALPIAGFKQRTLLAVLLLHAERLVPADVLIDKLWPDRAPASARNLVQGYVSDLRHALGKAGPDGSPLVTSQSGYLLQVDGEQLDALRFERLVEASRAARAAGDPRLAADRLQAATALWRGPALTGVSPGTLRGEAVRLDEARLTALEDRFELELELGRHTQVVGELAALRSEHPLRERPIALLMVALSRSGRHAEALAAYREARRSLVQEHGLDPGPTLQRLELAILKSDPALAPAEAAVVAPPRAAPADPPAPLPSPLTALIGREDELAGLTALLPSARLVTLTGPGGVGKTRLALEAARVAAAGFPDRVTFVPLSGLRDPALIGRAIADALGLREVGGRPVRDVLRERLTGAPRLLLLDNFEHLLEAGPDVADLLAACPDLHVLVTSRAPLGVRGEQRFPIAPLPEAPAIELFVERARAAQPALDLSPASRDVFARICQRLDRLPLALELAAARVAILEPVELLARLDPVLPMLAGGLRDLPERQQTMRGAIAWSCELLSPEERLVFRRLAVFVGGWTLDDAAAVCELGPDGPERTRRCLAHLSSLLDMSLVVRDRSRAGPGGPRFDMLETIRAYALEQLAENGEAPQVRDRHAERFAAVAAQAAHGLRGREQLSWLDRLSRDSGNVRAALAWFLGRDRADRVVELGRAIWLYWYARDKREGWQWMQRALARPEQIDIGTRAKALFVAGSMRYLLRSAGSRPSGDGPADGDSARPPDDRSAQAMAMLDESIELAARAGDEETLGNALEQRGFVAALLSDGDAAGYFARCAAVCRRRSDRLGTAWALIGQAAVACGRGDHAAALRFLDDAEALGAEEAPPRFACIVLDYRGLIALEQRDDPLAELLFGRCAQIAGRLGETWILVLCLVHLAGVAVRSCQARRAISLLAATTRLAGTIDEALPAAHQQMREQYLAESTARLPAGEIAAAWREGLSTSPAHLLRTGAS
jgi:predicted ATPase/DNA-binding SARP family transcriptional activator